MNQIIVITLLLSCKLSLEDFISLFHDRQKHGANVEFLQGEPWLEMQEVRICLTDECEDSTGILIRFDGQFVCIYNGFLPKLLELVDGVQIIEEGEDLMGKDSHALIRGL
jgi:hypothetical protein